MYESEWINPHKYCAAMDRRRNYVRLRARSVEFKFSRRSDEFDWPGWFGLYHRSFSIPGKAREG